MFIGDSRPAILGVSVDMTEHLKPLKTKRTGRKIPPDYQIRLDTIWVLNLNQGKFTYISPAIYSLRGLTVEEALTEKLEDAMTPESQALVKKAIERDIQVFLKDPEKPHYYLNEIQQPRKDGTLVWVEVATKFRFNKNGEIEIVGVSRNLEERKNFEKKLQGLINDLEKSQQLAKVGSWELDLEQQRFSSSHEGLRIFGFSLETNPSLEEVTALMHRRIGFGDIGLQRALKTLTLTRMNSHCEKRHRRSRRILSIGEVERTPQGRPQKLWAPIRILRSAKVWSSAATGKAAGIRQSGPV